MSELLEALIESHPDTKFLTADGFDEAIIGYHQQSERLIYSVRKCVEILVEDGMTVQDAEEYFYFNVEGAYVGEKTPIWCDDNYDI